MKFIDKYIAQNDFNPQAASEKPVFARFSKTSSMAFAERLSRYSAIDFREFKAAVQNHFPQSSVKNSSLRTVFKNRVSNRFSPVISRFMGSVTKLRPNRRSSGVYAPTI